MKLSNHIKDEWKTNEIVDSQENKTLEEGLLRAILEPLGIYFVATWLANLFEKVADYQDGFNSKLISAEKEIIRKVGSDDIVKKINDAYYSGASPAKMAEIYVNHSETQKEIKKYKNDKRVTDGGGIEALEKDLIKIMTQAYGDVKLQRQTVKDLENKLK
jgi:hypothetical protein